MTSVFAFIISIWIEKCRSVDYIWYFGKRFNVHWLFEASFVAYLMSVRPQPSGRADACNENKNLLNKHRDSVEDNKQMYW